MKRKIILAVDIAVAILTIAKAIKEVTDSIRQNAIDGAVNYKDPDASGNEGE